MSFSAIYEEPLFTKIEGIFNSTTMYILSRMELGESKQSALAEAQARGIAEADPSLDVNGIDTAYKLCIIAKVALGMPDIRPEDLACVEGISAVDASAVTRNGECLRLVARAERVEDGQWELSVKPRYVARDSFLGSCSGTDMHQLHDRSF